MTVSRKDQWNKTTEIELRFSNFPKKVKELITRIIDCIGDTGLGISESTSIIKDSYISLVGRDKEREKLLSAEAVALIKDIDAMHEEIKNDSSLNLYDAFFFILKILNGKPTSPLTGDHSEWIEIADVGDEVLYQNIRLGTIFRKIKKSKDNPVIKSYDLDAYAVIETVVDDKLGPIENKRCLANDIKFPYNPANRLNLFSTVENSMVFIENDLVASAGITSINKRLFMAGINPSNGGIYPEVFLNTEEDMPKVLKAFSSLSTVKLSTCFNIKTGYIEEEELFDIFGATSADELDMSAIAKAIRLRALAGTNPSYIVSDPSHGYTFKGLDFVFKTIEVRYLNNEIVLNNEGKQLFAILPLTRFSEEECKITDVIYLDEQLRVHLYAK